MQLHVFPWASPKFMEQAGFHSRGGRGGTVATHWMRLKNHSFVSLWPLFHTYYLLPHMAVHGYGYISIAGSIASEMECSWNTWNPCILLQEWYVSDYIIIICLTTTTLYPPHLFHTMKKIMLKMSTGNLHMYMIVCIRSFLFIVWKSGVSWI